MINNIKKLELYNILNSIKMAYLKSKEPFNILQSDIKLTYKIVELKYLKDKNYFVKVKKSTGSNKFSKPTFSKEEHDAYLERKNRRDRSQSPTKNYNNDKNKTRSQSPNQKPNRVFTAEETAAYLERKNRRDRSQSPGTQDKTQYRTQDKTQYRTQPRAQSPNQKPNRVFTAEETAAYLERQNRRDRSQSPDKKHNKSPYITDRDQNRDQNRSRDRDQKPNRVFTAEETAAYLERQNRRDRSQSPTQKTGGFKKNSNHKVLVYC
jgi:hypothetical protein